MLRERHSAVWLTIRPDHTAVIGERLPGGTRNDGALCLCTALVLSITAIRGDARTYGIKALSTRDDRVAKAYLVEKIFNCNTLRFRAAGPNFPIAMGVCIRVPYDHPADRAPPCLSGATSLANQTSNEKHFEV